MKKILPAIAGALLGLLFVMVSVVVLFHLVKEPPMTPGSPAEMFAKAFGPTGYMTFVKVCELVGGLLVMVPLTRNLGLLVLGPIIINIVAYHLFVGNGVSDLANPMIIGIILLPLYLLWVERKSWAALLHRAA